MSETLWAQRPLPTPASDAVVVGRWRPASLRDLTVSRRELAAALHDGARPPGADEGAVERLTLAFEELASNALRHGRPPIDVTVTRAGHHWLLAVSDGAADVAPVPAEGRDAAFGGLGLYLVARMAGAHGWSAGPDGRKTVWARIDFSRSEPESPGAGAPAFTAGTHRERPAGQRPARRLALRRASVLVAVVVLAVTAALVVLARQVNAHGEQRLLDRQLAQVGSLLTNQGAVIQTELADIGTVAVNTGANPAAFARFAGRQLQQTGQSLSLWRISGGTATKLAQQGVAPRLPAGGADTLAGVKADGKLAILGILRGRTDRITYALRPAEGAGDLVVYAESPLPAGHRIPAAPGSPLAGLDVALYLGREAAPGSLLESTAPVPIQGDPRTARVPFGDAVVTIVGSSPTHLSGTLAASLPWTVLGVGCALAVAGAATLETFGRRREAAERLAAENRELYRQQRGIAGTLQHALLPAVPAIGGIDVAARYVAGVDSLQVGGDWYDVVECRPGSVVFVVGDVSGRGLPAATTMAALRFAVRGFIAEGHDIATVLQLLRRMLDIDVDHQFATVLLGSLDLGTRTLRLVSAGHFGPLLLTDGAAEFVPCPPDPPVGVPADGAPRVTEVALPADATLLAFTDGAVERRGEVLDTGLERLRAAAAAGPARPLPEMLDHLLTTLTADGGKDDTVVLGVRWASRRGAHVQG